MSHAHARFTAEHYRRLAAETQIAAYDAMASQRDTESAATDTTTHSHDTDCTVGDDGECTGCHVYHGDPCPTCGQRAYHADGCDEISPEVMAAVWPELLPEDREERHVPIHELIIDEIRKYELRKSDLRATSTELKAVAL